MTKYPKLFVNLIMFCSFFCLCCTPYKSVGFRGGYSEIRLDTNIFNVSFKGNGYTSTERATDFCLLRCAEICSLNGFDYFVIVDSQTEITKSTYVDNVKSESNYTVKNYGNTSYIHGKTTTRGGNTHEIHKPGVINTIICYKGRPLNQDILHYKPEFLISSIKTKYNITERK